MNCDYLQGSQQNYLSPVSSLYQPETSELENSSNYSESKVKKNNNLSVIPVDILKIIYIYSDVKNFLNFRLVCKDWNKISLNMKMYFHINDIFWTVALNHAIHNKSKSYYKLDDLLKFVSEKKIWEFFLLADECKNFEVLIKLLSHPKFNSSLQSKARLHIIEKMPLDSIKILMESSTIDVTLIVNLAIISKRFEIINAISENVNYNPGYKNNLAFRWASRHNCVNCIEKLFKHKSVNPIDLNYEALVEAIGNDSIDVLKVFIYHPLFDSTLAPTQSLLEAYANGFYLACEKGSARTLFFYLNHQLPFNLIDTDEALTKVCESNHLLILELLIEDERFDPSFNHNQLLQSACLKGNTSIVKILLQDERVNPADQNNQALKNAYEKKFTAIFLELLKDSRVDPTCDNHYILKNALKKNYLTLLCELLKDPRVDPSFENNFLLKNACQKKSLTLVSELLKDPRLDPTFQNNYLYRKARLKGQIELANLLSSDSRVKTLIEREDNK